MFGIDTAKLIVYGVIAVAVMILLGLIYNAIGNHFTAPLKLELKACQQATEKATNANAQLQGDLAKLREQLQAQNQQVADLEAQSQKNVAASQAAIAAAKARSASMESTIAALKQIAESKGNDNGCPAVDKLLTDLANDRVRYNGSTGQSGSGIGSQGSGNGSLRIH